MAAHYFPEVEHGRAPVVVALIVLVVGMVAAFVIGTPTGTTRGEPAARAFLVAWERSRLATYVVRSDFVRTLPDGNQLKSTTTTVQRPEATDETIAREIRIDVRPDDLRMPDDRGAVVGQPGPAAPGG